MLRAFGLGLIGFVATAIATYLVVVIGTSLVWDLLGVHDQDGGGSMVLGLVIAPVCALIGGMIGAFVLPAWASSRTQEKPPES